MPTASSPPASSPPASSPPASSPPASSPPASSPPASQPQPVHGPYPGHEYAEGEQVPHPAGPAWVVAEKGDFEPRQQHLEHRAVVGIAVGSQLVDACEVAGGQHLWGYQLGHVA
ncbi:hypothetical protein [Hymenobacter siberiensis]|uniref:hypothetical protein n=1 Tax=Hymenobacter siberiensis TaxID=2848396 RepID=UPI001C1E7821|nr:hypothetical protein [Hymenobacter siberiensis]MBU6120655.1 hypothetical protein [Hymenobacter siberiensis]